MILRYPFLALVGCLVGTILFSPAQEPRPQQDWQRAAVKFPPGPVTLKDALDHMQKETGNVVNDLRGDTAKTFLKNLPAQITFWPLIDAIGKETGIGFSAYQPDGGVALIESPYRKLETCYADPFRFAIKRVAVSRDDETKVHACDVALDIAWEPRFRALYLNLESAQVAYAPDIKKIVLTHTLEPQAMSSVAEISARELDLRLPAPDRTSPSIAALHGSIHVIGTPKLLHFTFKLGKPLPLKEAQEKVNFSLSKLTKRISSWTVAMRLEYPKDALVPLRDTNQSLWLNNQVWLEWKGRKLKTDSTHETLMAGNIPVGASITAHFIPRDGIPLPGNADDVTLHYLVPNRVVSITAPFAFKDLPLP
jgi:hypothetical protein